MTEDVVPPSDVASALEVLASDVRLRLLRRLGAPAFVPDLAREFGLTRQAIQKHVDALESAGLVRSAPSRRGVLTARVYRADPAGLFALKESVLGIGLPAEPIAFPPALGAGLLLVHGDRPGRWFPLPARGSAIVGAGAAAHVPLAYDPFVSERHALLQRAFAGWTITDLGSARGTQINFQRLPPDEVWPLREGDLLTFGKSHLLFRGGR